MTVQRKDKPRTAQCRDCGREILWAITARGKKVALDGNRVKRRFVLGPKQQDIRGWWSPLAESVLTYETHWSVCPAREWEADYEPSEQVDHDALDEAARQAALYDAA
jgi:hypothetical protein